MISGHEVAACVIGRCAARDRLWGVISAKCRSREAQRQMTQRSDLVPRNHICIEYVIIDMLRETLLDCGRAG